MDSWVIDNKLKASSVVVGQKIRWNGVVYDAVDTKRNGKTIMLQLVSYSGTTSALFDARKMLNIVDPKKGAYQVHHTYSGAPTVVVPAGYSKYMTMYHSRAEAKIKGSWLGGTGEGSIEWHPYAVHDRHLKPALRSHSTANGYLVLPYPYYSARSVSTLDIPSKTKYPGSKSWSAFRSYHLVTSNKIEKKIRDRMKNSYSAFTEADVSTDSEYLVYMLRDLVHGNSLTTTNPTMVAMKVLPYDTIAPMATKVLHRIMLPPFADSYTFPASTLKEEAQ